MALFCWHQYQPLSEKLEPSYREQCESEQKDTPAWYWVDWKKRITTLQCNRCGRTKSKQSMIYPASSA